MLHLKQYLKEVKLTMEDQERRAQEEARKGTYETTNKATYAAKPLDQNRVGCRVMYDQSGHPVGQ